MAQLLDLDQLGALRMPPALAEADDVCLLRQRASAFRALLGAAGRISADGGLRVVEAEDSVVMWLQSLESTLWQVPLLTPKANTNARRPCLKPTPDAHI